MRLTQRKLGWIGVDIGTSTVKIAQVARSKYGWRVAAAAVVPRQANWQAELAAGTKSLSSLDELQAAKSLQQGYRGREVAAILPMSLCDLHRLDCDLNRESNGLHRLQEAIETATQQSVGNVQCDYWSSPAIDSKPACTQALTVQRNWTDQLCEDIAQAGWNCKSIDGLPQAMTRAVGMVRSDAVEEPLAALDWGSGRATLCFIENEQPTYVRCLKHCGFRHLLEELAENLQLTELEAQRLLEEYGLATSSAEEFTDIAQLVQEVISDSLAHVVDEIKRSISHFQYVRRSPGPKHLFVFGGGAMIKDLDIHLSASLNVEARNWQLPASRPNEPSRDPSTDCLLASAIALSALAWEAS